MLEWMMSSKSREMRKDDKKREKSKERRIPESKRATVLL